MYLTPVLWTHHSIASATAVNILGADLKLMAAYHQHKPGPAIECPVSDHGINWNLALR